MRWLTCTPVAFRGGSAFFSRDSGLLSRGFESLGIESKAVMSLPGRSEDLPDLIRTEYENLESEDWWRGLEADGVVLYAWGLPRHSKVAAAISAAGCRLVLNQDSSGAVSPVGGPGAWLEDQWVHSQDKGGGGRLLRFAARILYGSSVGIVLRDLRRIGHLRHGDVIGAVSPIAVARYRKHCQILGGEGLARRVHLVPHPVAPHFRWAGGGRKESAVVAVGRWEAGPQKRPDLLCGAIARFAESHAATEFHVVGEPTPEMRRWSDGLPGTVRARVHLHGQMENQELVRIYQKSRILLCSSSFESFHIASGEALCCGCGIVAARRSTLPSLDWFAEQDGTLAERLNPQSIADALATEWNHWEEGRRDPRAISQRWSGRLHAPNIARKLLELAGE